MEWKKILKPNLIKILFFMILLFLGFRSFMSPPFFLVPGHTIGPFDYIFGFLMLPFLSIFLFLCMADICFIQNEYWVIGMIILIIIHIIWYYILACFLGISFKKFLKRNLKSKYNKNKIPPTKLV